MTRKELLLVLLMKECDELSQRASKALRFTLEEVQEGQPLTNAERIVYEFGDLWTVMEMLKKEGHLSYTEDELDHMTYAKRDKIKKYLEYSESKGALS